MLLPATPNSALRLFQGEVARVIVAGTLLILFFLAIPVCLVLVGSHPLTAFRKWADRLPQTMERKLLSRVLADAVARRVLIHTGDCYMFSDPVLRAVLAARYRADLDDRERERASKVPRPSRRASLVASLDDCGIDRISIDVAAAAAVYVVTISFTLAHAGLQTGFGDLFLSAVLICGGLIGVPTAAPFMRWTVANVCGLARGDAATAAVLAAAVLAALTIWSGPALGAALAAMLPVSFVAACGLWACLLARSRARGPLLHLPDAIVAITIGIAAAVLVRRSLLTSGPATVLLFPIATWGSVRVWRAMSHSGRLSVRTAADLTLSLLLGAELVLFAVWLFNLLDLSTAEVSVLRAVLGRAGSLADLPWWTWFTVYLILAGIVVALGRWSGLPRQIRDLLRVAPTLAVTKRVLTVVHIGLLVIVFIAVSAPATVSPLLRHQIAVRYDIALQREMEEAQVLDAYTWIQVELVATTPRSGDLPEIVGAILNIAPPSSDGKGTATESDLARRLGRLQATTLTFSAPPQTTKATADDTPSLGEDLGNLDAEEQKVDAITKQADKIGEFLAIAVANTIFIPDVSNHRVVQVVQEYLSGLIEESSLKDVLAAWYRKIRWGNMPPPADEIVFPDAARLEKTASAELDRTTPQSQDVANALKAIRGESPAVAAVELANVTRYSQEGAGPCDSICRLATPPGALDQPVVNQHEPDEPAPLDDPFGELPH